jgi:Fe2+ or Zn2+ uptake regulation protein
VDAELEQVVAAIKAHFSAHPNAADTVDGIASWWLPESAQGASHALVERALQTLVVEGLVKSRRIANGTVVYSLNRDPG